MENPQLPSIISDVNSIVPENLKSSIPPYQPRIVYEVNSSNEAHAEAAKENNSVDNKKEPETKAEEELIKCKAEPLSEAEEAPKTELPTSPLPMSIEIIPDEPPPPPIAPMEMEFRLTLFPSDQKPCSIQELDALYQIYQESYFSATAKSNYFSHCLHFVLSQPKCIWCKYRKYSSHLFALWNNEVAHESITRLQERTAVCLGSCRGCVEHYYESIRNLSQFLEKEVEEVESIKKAIEDTDASRIQIGLRVVDSRSPRLIFALFEVLIYPRWITHAKLRQDFETVILGLLSTKRMLKVSEPLPGVLACLFYPRLEIAKWAQQIIIGAKLKFSKLPNINFGEECNVVALSKESLNTKELVYFEHLCLIHDICEQPEEVLGAIDPQLLISRYGIASLDVLSRFSNFVFQIEMLGSLDHKEFPVPKSLKECRKDLNTNVKWEELNASEKQLLWVTFWIDARFQSQPSHEATVLSKILDALLAQMPNFTLPWYLAIFQDKHLTKEFLARLQDIERISKFLDDFQKSLAQVEISDSVQMVCRAQFESIICVVMLLIDKRMLVPRAVMYAVTMLKTGVLSLVSTITFLQDLTIAVPPVRYVDLINLPFFKTLCCKCMNKINTMKRYSLLVPDGSHFGNLLPFVLSIDKDIAHIYRECFRAIPCPFINLLKALDPGMHRWIDNLLTEVISPVLFQENFALAPELAHLLFSISLSRSTLCTEAAIISGMLIDTNQPELKPTVENLKRVLTRYEGADNPRLYKVANRLGLTLLVPKRQTAELPFLFKQVEQLEAVQAATQGNKIKMMRAEMAKDAPGSAVIIRKPPTMTTIKAPSVVTMQNSPSKKQTTISPLRQPAVTGAKRPADSYGPPKRISHEAPKAQSSDDEVEELNGATMALSEAARLAAINAAGAITRQVKLIDIENPSGSVATSASNSAFSYSLNRVIAQRDYNGVTKKLHRFLCSLAFEDLSEKMVEAHSAMKRTVPQSFTSALQYIECFEGLHQVECLAQLVSDLTEQAENQTMICKVTSVVSVDDFYEVSLSQPYDDGASRSFSEHDVLIIDCGRVRRMGVVSCVTAASTVCRILNQNDAVQLVREGLEWRVRELSNVVTSVREYLAMYFLNTFDPSVTSLILNPAYSGYNLGIDKPLQNTMDLNDSQLQAIRVACNPKNVITLIQGPPGTGKTKTIEAIVENELHYQQQDMSSTGASGILICAPSNAAVDELTLRLMSKKYSVVRMGNPEMANEAVRPVLLDSLVDTRLQSSIAPTLKVIEQHRLDIRNMSSRADQTESNEDKARIWKLRDTLRKSLKLVDDAKSGARTAILKSSDIVCCTLSAAGHDALVRLDRTFPLVIVDEACQAVELSTLIPLQHGARRVVLVGDPQQLPPTVISQAANYEASLFQRLANKIPVQLLSVQYRMHPEISRFPCTYFYKGLLVDGPGIAATTATPWHRVGSLGPFRFFDVAHGVEQSRKNRSSLFNDAEARAVIQLITHLKSTQPSDYNWRDRIAVITPYSEQRRRIRHEFARSNILPPDAVTISTVDGFQGQEREIIIFSCVRTGTSTSGSLGFLTDTRRINVALTRAKSSLWVIGKGEALRRNKLWRALVEDATSRSLVVKLPK